MRQTCAGETYDTILTFLQDTWKMVLVLFNGV